MAGWDIASNQLGYELNSSMIFNQSHLQILLGCQPIQPVINQEQNPITGRRMRLYAISDLHADFTENWNLIHQLETHCDDGLIVAGDIADSLDLINKTFDVLQEKFKIIFYTPGNHELWTRDYPHDSLHKLNSILELCDRRQIVTQPQKAGNYWIVPLYSWYDCILPINKNTIIRKWADYHLCKWPFNDINLVDYFASLNHQNIRAYDGKVISFSHFLPTVELLPEIEYLRFKALPQVAISPILGQQIRSINSEIHIFGHSHINCDVVIGKTRYIQNAVRYPRERKNNSFKLKFIAETNDQEGAEAALILQSFKFSADDRGSRGIIE